jgi:Vacuolar sorting protein 9 (VPS9) domain
LSSVASSETKSREDEQLPSGISSREMIHLDNVLIAQLKTHPSDDDVRALVRGHLTMILQLKFHPLGGMLAGLCDRVAATLDEVTLDEYTEQIAYELSATIWRQIDEMVFGTLSHYKDLKRTQPRIDATQQTVAEAVWSALHEPLIALYARKYAAADAMHGAKIQEFLTLSPAHLGIRREFWLLPHADGGDDDDNGHGDGSSVELTRSLKPPYSEAIVCFQRVTLEASPFAKCQALVDTARLICDAITEHWQGRRDPSELTVSGDDLLPLITYIVIKANVSHLYVHAKFMEHFIDDVASIQHHGYILATLQTALAFIVCLNQDKVQQSALDLLGASLRGNASQSQGDDDEDGRDDDDDEREVQVGDPLELFFPTTASSAEQQQPQQQVDANDVSSAVAVQVSSVSQPASAPKLVAPPPIAPARSQQPLAPPPKEAAPSAPSRSQQPPPKEAIAPSRSQQPSKEASTNVDQVRQILRSPSATASSKHSSSFAGLWEMARGGPS